MSGDGLLVSHLETVLGRPVASATVRRSPYTSSFPIDEIDIVTQDGEGCCLVRKDVDRRSCTPDARANKPKFLHDPHREAAVYELLLPQGPEGPPRLWGTICTEGRPRWLFLDPVDGVELFQIGDLRRWCSAARWLAQFHGSSLLDPAVGVPLLVHDEGWYRQWATRALSVATPSRRRAVGELVGLGRIASLRLLGGPQTVLHGEFYASNVLVGDAPGGGVRVAPVDWEMAAVGSPASDLAALTSGNWSEPDRRAIEDAYFEERGDDGSGAIVDQGLLAAARVANALQWLGWTPQWRPPVQHRSDWLANGLAQRDPLGEIA